MELRNERSKQSVLEKINLLKSEIKERELAIQLHTGQELRKREYQSS